MKAMKALNVGFEVLMHVMVAVPMAFVMFGFGYGVALWLLGK